MKKLTKNRIPSGMRISTFIMAVVMLLSSCTFYHNKHYTNINDTAKKIAQRDDFNYIIVHNGNSYWNLRYPRVKDEFVTGELEPLDAKVDSCYRHSLVKTNYREKGEPHLHGQLHLHVDEFEAVGNMVTIPFANVKKIEVEKKNKGLSFVTNTALTTVSVIGGLTLLLVIACNCPHNYVYDGENYQFNNTLFTGANTPSLERDDYKYLPDFFPDSSSYRMIIKNEEKEIQYTNLLELLAVDHASNIKVVSTQKGEILTIQSPVQATSVKTDSDKEIALYTNSEDDLFYAFEETGNDDLSHLYAEFPVENKGKNAKIIVRAKNSAWAGLVNRSFNSLVGNNYSKWMKRNTKKSAEELNDIREKAGIPLIVSIRQGNDWIPLETIQLVGDVAFNDVAVSIPEKYITEETVEFKLSSGFKFWELDALYMDYSTPGEFTVATLSPDKAQGKNDFKSQITKDDKEYMVHQTAGDSANVVFAGIPKANGKRTLILHSKGYYTSNEEYKGRTEWKALAAIRRAGGLSYFSKSLFEYYTNAAKK